MSQKNDDDLKQTEKLFAFLQGEMPEGIKVSRSHRPKLTPAQAWTVIWYLGNLYWQPTDVVERCDLCGLLYHSWQEGYCLDFGKAPHFFCESCMDTEDFRRKESSRLNPDRSQRG